MNIYPILDRIVVQKIEPSQPTKSQLFLPEQPTQDKPFLATVVAVPLQEHLGKDVKIFIKKGDKVLFTKYAGVEWKIDKQTFIILRQNDILAIVKEEESACQNKSYKD